MCLRLYERMPVFLDVRASILVQESLDVVHVLVRYTNWATS